MESRWPYSALSPNMFECRLRSHSSISWRQALHAVWVHLENESQFLAQIGKEIAKLELHLSLGSLGTIPASGTLKLLRDGRYCIYTK